MKAGGGMDLEPGLPDLEVTVELGRDRRGGKFSIVSLPFWRLTIGGFTRCAKV